VVAHPAQQIEYDEQQSRCNEKHTPHAPSKYPKNHTDKTCQETGNQDPVFERIHPIAALTIRDEWERIDPRANTSGSG